MKKSWKIILMIILSTGLTLVIFIASVFLGAFGHLQSKNELLSYKNATATVVFSEEGEVIGKIFSENRTNISYDLIPQHLINALIATEDARFFEHEGIDSRGLLRVLFKTILLKKQSSGGGSTISQQLAKNMFGRKKSGLFATFENKTKEIFLAHRLEKIFSKQEILTLYLNTVPFGENVFGIEAASRRYFNKKVELLNIEEAAVLVGMLKANDYYNPRLHPDNAKTRRNIVLNQLKKYNYLGSAETDSLCRLPLVQNYANLESKGPADYFLYQVKNEAKRILEEVRAETGKKWNLEEDGLTITTTLNLTLQNYVNDSFHEHLARMQKKLNAQYESVQGKKIISALAVNELKNLKLTEKADEIGLRQIFDWDGPVTDSISISDSLMNAIKLLHAGLIAVNPVTGAVKAWVGGIDFRTQPYDQILARRQLASTFKPVLYAEALEEGIKPCYYLDNDSIILPDVEGWSPENFDHSHGGKYSLTGALVHSMNIPTFNLFMNVGFSNLDSMWIKMGFSFPLENNPSLAIGTAEATIMELATAYSLFANGGYMITPQKIVSIKSSDGAIIWQNDFSKTTTRILTERTSQLMSAILQRAVREGTGVIMGSVYGVTLPLGGKTGTSQDYADAWFAAFNPTLVLVSRVGASLPSVHFNDSGNGSGSALALPLVAMTLKKVQMNHDLMNQLISPFPVLAPELAEELDCPDFKEKITLRNFFDFLKRDKTRVEKDTSGSVHRKKSFFERIFGTRKSRRNPR
jgi:penicillin-binding protein 1A